jgi:hypothetical protein
MRPFLALIFLSLACLTGCESDLPPNPGSTDGVNMLQRGMTGQGTLTQPDTSNDPVIRGNPATGN